MIILQISNMINGVLGMMVYGCYAIAAGMIIYIAIRYMMAPANERADLKGGVIRYVFGAILLAGSGVLFSGILKVLK